MPMSRLLPVHLIVGLMSIHPRCGNNNHKTDVVIL
jgi:hypothetical protein